jgi:hypothetical protein
MRVLVWPLKSVVLAALAAVGMLLVSGVKAPEPEPASVTIEANSQGAHYRDDPYGGVGGFWGAGY